jgi:bifunctional non-homologous end joining protein LigD
MARPVPRSQRQYAHIHNGPAKLVAPAASLKTHAAILDGEVVVHGDGGGTDFNELEREIGKRGGSDKLVFYVFDLLYLDGLDLRAAGLVERKAVLLEFLSSLDPGERIKYSEHFEGDGAQLRERACDLGLEGVVSKRGTAAISQGAPTTG